MNGIKNALKKMVPMSEEVLLEITSRYYTKTFKKKSFLFKSGQTSDKVFYINKGLIRVYLTDLSGTEHTSFFALENMFICDYSSFLLNSPGNYNMQAMEDTEVVVLPKHEIIASYADSLEANMIGRKIAEHYFILFDQRIQDTYLKTPKQRYDELTNVFPNIHQRVPQHMIASFLNISAVHLSRLKAND